MSNIINHIHMFEKAKWNKLLYRCAHPECFYTAHRDKVLGKKTLCNLCSAIFILTREDLRRSKPRCPECSKTKHAARELETALEINETVAELFKEE